MPPRGYRGHMALWPAQTIGSGRTELAAGRSGADDTGTIQITDRGTGSLRIAVQAGFQDDFVSHIAVVDDGGPVCGSAARRHAQVVIADVLADPAFAPHEETGPLLTPRGPVDALIGRSGRIRRCCIHALPERPQPLAVPPPSADTRPPWTCPDSRSRPPKPTRSGSISSRSASCHAR